MLYDRYPASGHFTRNRPDRQPDPAAEQLNLTQSAVSHAIRRFEDRYGVKLWEREGHKLRLTLAGNYLLGLAMRVLPQLEHGASVIEDYARGRRGAIRVGMECHPCQDWLMRVVDPFLRNGPMSSWM